ncbi:MAG: SlyX family protein [Spirochaetota bacterium]
MDNENAARLQDLEIKFAYQDQALSELSGLVYEYGKRLDSLEEKIQSTLARLAGMGNEKNAGASDMAAQERPPHY